MKVFKYPLTLTDEQEVRMPVGSNILCAQDQNGVLTLWAEVDPTEKEEETRYFSIRGTGGKDIPEGADARYIGTAQVGPVFVWHVYEVLP